MTWKVVAIGFPPSPFTLSASQHREVFMVINDGVDHLLIIP